jgi:hypothetical protein
MCCKQFFGGVTPDRSAKMDLGRTEPKLMIKQLKPQNTL